jgi:Flp pilus assembly protein TadG
MNFVRNLTALARQNDGNVAVTFALSLAVLCLAGGLAIDYARAFGTQAMMQADLDAAVLGAAKKMADPAAVQAAAERMFNANWAKKHNVKNVQISVEQSNPRTLVGTAKARVPTTLMGIAGLTGVNVHARSEVEVAGNEIELSLVLDTTASMSGTKIAALKTSAKMLIDDVYDARSGSTRQDFDRAVRTIRQRWTSQSQSIMDASSGRHADPAPRLQKPAAGHRHVELPYGQSQRRT